jgi:isoleucyl-tRNA synthetase
MVAGRPDWVLSRQRAWGVPLTIFVKPDGTVLRDPAVNERIIKEVEARGADAWADGDPKRFLSSAQQAEDWTAVTDILDVWFDSGSTHAFVLEARPDLGWPAQLYLEGSDQHRGWFQSSLLESCFTRGRAPYEQVVTHGFIMDQQGRKMSKSLGNTVEPQEIIAKDGADILRLWVAGSDYTEDLRMGPEVLKTNSDLYRKLRNTIRFTLSNLKGFDAAERIEPHVMPELDRYILHRLAELDRAIRASYSAYDFPRVVSTVVNFCANDLSAFYYDIRKDALYCDPATSTRRRAARTVMDLAFDALTAWLAPVLCFTAEEAWQMRHGGDVDSVHLRLFPNFPDAWLDPDLAAKWERIRQLRRVITGALEIERREKRIGSSLEACPVLYLTQEADRRLFDGLDLAEIAISSAARIDSGPGPDGAFTLDDVSDAKVVAERAEGQKCGRCWMILPEVGSSPRHNDLCHRCDETVAHL